MLSCCKDPRVSNVRFCAAFKIYSYGMVCSWLIKCCAADTGWDIFSLHYNLQAPVNSVIPASSMLQYQQIFDFLWRLKRVEHSLSASWTKDMNLGHEVQVSVGEIASVRVYINWRGCTLKLQGCIPGIRPVLHRSQLVRSEMIHFSTNLLNYMMFEVIRLTRATNCNWHANNLLYRWYLRFSKLPGTSW